ncbi:hypothetical protein VTK73DRAFT_7757 [Phialemonium thermophilum]|uniref:Uncharacterized protein n=1 Tax=Phialemonium thermophilum TaxID=223376 RepID=A0ABR3XS69_9PEZI
MASNFHIQKPYLLTTLPSPSGAPDAPGKYVVGEVFGQRWGHKKRKRLELSVGIDGDAVNIYDVSSSRLLTSYPIPPQYAFTCPPCSIRWKGADSKQIVRSTYISTEENQGLKRRITLFKDVVGPSGVTVSTSTFRILRQHAPVVHLTTTPTSDTAVIRLAEKERSPDLLAVTEDGTVVCLDGESLDEKWSSSPSIFSQGLDTTPPAFRVEMVQVTTAADTIAGVFHGRHDAFGVFCRMIEADGFNPVVLCVVTAATPGSSSRRGERHFHILAIPPDDQEMKNGKQTAVLVTSVIIPPLTLDKPDRARFRLDVASGFLEELCNDTLFTYRLDDDVPKLVHTLTIPDVVSFLRLSESSVLTATKTSVAVYNPAYRSQQTSAPLVLDDEPQTNLQARDGQDRCELVTYFKHLEIAIALQGPALMAVQLEAPKSRKRKRRTQGLLIDSIGRGLPQGAEPHQWSKPKHRTSSLAEYLPGTFTDVYWGEWQRDSAQCDEFLRAGNLSAFERLLASKFSIELVQDDGPGASSKLESRDSLTLADTETILPEWKWPSTQTRFPPVDRRWVLYAINRLLSLQVGSERDSDGTKLACRLPQTNVFAYLVLAGHLSSFNLKSALSEGQDLEDIGAILSEHVPQLLVDVDPTLELLVAYLTTTVVGTIELLSSIRLIMRSLGLVQDPTKLSQTLTMGDEDGGARSEEEAIGMDLDKLEEDLTVTEHLLLDDAGTRTRGLTISLGLLAACPPSDTVRTIRRLFRPEETLSLMHVLRIELVKGGWTTRYLDTSYLDGDGDLEPPPDGSIRLIADLLSRCIDSVGPGGWMVNDAILARSEDALDSTDYLSALKLEVSAALEGIQEAVYLRGIVSQAVKYATGVQKSLAGQTAEQKDGQSKPIVMRQAQSRMLPLGLGTKSKIPTEKVVSGGEIVQRSKRERGHLGSQKVGAYTLERVSV